jgi:hypothetical protein
VEAVVVLSEIDGSNAMLSKVAMIGALAWCFGFLCAGAAPAAAVFSFASDQSNYNVTPGASTNINVFLKETLGQGDTDILLSQGGLLGFDLSLSRSTGVGAIRSATPNPSPASFASVFASQVSPSPFPQLGISQADMVLLSADSPGPTGTLAGNTRTILLASFVVSGGTTVGSQTTFVLSPSTLFGVNTLTNSGTALDSTIQNGGFTLSVVAPEPATVGLLFPCAMLLARRRNGAKFI